MTHWATGQVEAGGSMEGEMTNRDVRLIGHRSVRLNESNSRSTD